MDLLLSGVLKGMCRGERVSDTPSGRVLEVKVFILDSVNTVSRFLYTEETKVPV